MNEQIEKEKSSAETPELASYTEWALASHIKYEEFQNINIRQGLFVMLIDYSNDSIILFG